MKHLKKLKIGVLFFILILYSVNNTQAQNFSSQKKINIDYLVSQAECGKWKVVKKGEGVAISTRWLNFGDSLKTREVVMYFKVDATTSDVLYSLQNTSILKQWNNSVRKLKVFNRTDSTWVTHMVYDIPYPFAQQDLVTKNTIIEHEKNIIIDVNAEPELVQLIKDVNRQRYYFGQWQIKALQDEKTEVRFSVISFSKSNIPRFIRDPIVQSKLLSSFIKLKELSANHGKLAALQTFT